MRDKDVGLLVARLDGVLDGPVALLVRPKEPLALFERAAVAGVSRKSLGVVAKVSRLGRPEVKILADYVVLFADKDVENKILKLLEARGGVGKLVADQRYCVEGYYVEAD